jgi:hypothetical protein
MKARVLRELGAVATFALLGALAERAAGAQAAFAIAWLVTLPCERLGRRSWRHAAGAWLGSLGPLWGGFTLLNSGFAWPCWVAAAVARLALGGVRWRREKEAAAPDGRELIGQVAAIGIGWVVIWTAAQKWEFPRIGEQRDYYNLLAHGFSKGSLAVDLQPSPELLAAKNPWNSAERPPGSAPADISFYEGKFYTYFGVVPTLLFVWPFQLLTGQDLPLVYLMILFCVGAFALLVRLWTEWLRDCFPSAGITTRVAGVILLGLGSGLLALARRGSVWEMPIAGGQLFLAATLLLAYRALRAERPFWSLAGTGTCLGLACGCRPTYAFAGGALVVLVIALEWGRHSSVAAWGRGVARSALTAGLPLAAIVAGILFYNYQRFDHPLEFGLNYQLTAGYEAQATHFSTSFVPYNFRLYFLASPSWGRYFPFVHPVEGLPAAPARYYGYEFVYGLFVTNPLAWALLLVPVLLWRRRGRERAWGGLLLAVAAGMTAVLLCFNTAAARYAADFLSPWLLLAAGGLALVDDGLRQRIVVRRVWSGLVAAGALFAGAVAYGAAAELHGVFRFHNPAGYATVARLLNLPVDAIEALRGVPAGPVELRVVFPERPANNYEPLLTVGAAYETDRFEVGYAGAGHVTFRYHATNRQPLFTREVQIEPGREYRLRLESGALYPPTEHRLFDAWPRGEVIARKRWVSIELDGEKLLEQAAYAHEAAPELIRVGDDRQRDVRFSGRILGVERAPVRAAGAIAIGDEIAMRIVFPDGANRARQPLVVAGEPGAAELVLLRMLDEHSAVFGYERWGYGYWESAPVAIPPGRAAELRVRIPSAGKKATGGAERLRRGVTVWLDDRVVAHWQLGEPLASSAVLEVGWNAVGSSVAIPQFEGRLTQVRGARSEWRPGAFQELRVELAPDGKPGIDPLVTIGRTAAGEALGLEWGESGRARLVYQPRDGERRTSEYFPWTPGVVRTMRISWAAFLGLDEPSGPSVRSGPLRVWLDDALVWEVSVASAAAVSRDLLIGTNDAARAGWRREFAGAVLSVAQNPR